jgi:hypothetical protein
MVMWSWCLKSSFRIDGCSSLPGSIITLCHICKCHTKLYLAMSNTLHPWTLQVNFAPSFAQCTPYNITGGGATTFETNIIKPKKSNVGINVLGES